MITTTLIANGAKAVFIIGPKQAELDKCALMKSTHHNY